MATIKKIKKAQTGKTLPEVTVTSKAAKKPNFVERIIGTPEKRAERKEEREGRKAERQSNREVRRYEREDRRRSRCTGSGCASKAGFGGYNKNGGVTKAKTGMKIKKKMQAGGVAGKQLKAGMVDPNGAYTKVQERTLGNMKKGGKIRKAQDGFREKSKMTYKDPLGNYKIKINQESGDGKVTTSGKVRRTLKGFLSGAPKPNANKKNYSSETTYKKGGKVTKRK